jgi:DNA helicase-2/ATP-dependent DNA helicase PcrA
MMKNNMNLNPEKLNIIAQNGNVLVTANPGTGKTLLLAGKYVDLLKKKVDPEKILCLTFTEKAKGEMEERIIKAIKDEKMEFDYSKLNVFTFHAYALSNLEKEEIISSNLLRYAIYRYVMDNDILDYNEDHIIDTLVPKMENLIRYLKSFNITPKDINLNEVKAHISDTDKYDKEQLDTFAGHFLNIFKHYEAVKSKKGYDYGDLLIEFLKLKKVPVFDYVLVDELQDVNSMEADIVLRSCKNFFVVGDKKQAIFGFQGGSILNFEKFAKAKPFVLSMNYRSTNEILDYAKNYFNKSEDAASKEEVSTLTNPEAKKGEKPVIYETDKKLLFSAACDLLEKLKDKKQIAILARTNGQLIKVGKELKARKIEFTTTTSSSSAEAKENIIKFLLGMLSEEVFDVKTAMFTPFFPCPIQKSIALASDRDVTLAKIMAECPVFASLREKVKNVEDIGILFKEVIVPVAIAYGKEYLLAAMTLQSNITETFKVIDNVSIQNITAYLKSSDILSQEPSVESKVVLSTIHKAKGRQFDTVIYVPSGVRDETNFIDLVVEAILCSKGLNVSEELEEEDIRVNFVAFTRAENSLHIITDSSEDFVNDYSLLTSFDAKTVSAYDFTESHKKAYAMFLAGDEGARELILSRDNWIIDYVRNHFLALKHVSPTTLADNAYDYLIRRIINISVKTKAMQTGTDVHTIAESLSKGEKVDTDLKQFKENILAILDLVKKKYPSLVSAEEKVDIPLSKIMDTSSDLNFFGKIDAVFTDGSEYLILDWKTDRDDSYDSKYRMQLEAYRRAYAVKKNIDLTKIKTAIGFIGLRKRIKDGVVDWKFDEKQPLAKSFETFKKKVDLLLSWRNDVKKYFDDLIAEEKDDVMWRSVVEEYGKEMNQ